MQPTHSKGPEREMGRILVIDQGTTSTRAIVFDERARPLASAQTEFPQIYPHPGWIEHDPEGLWNTTLSTAREAVAKAVGPQSIAGIPNYKETTALGAAFLAGWRAGLYPAPGESAEYWGRDRPFAPMMSSQARERRAGWRAGVDATLYRREPLQ
jgi:glycerol kinase